MSLSIFLHTKEPAKESKPAIYIRRDGSTEEISRAEWDELFPGREPVMFTPPAVEENNEVYYANITHNLGTMAAEADLYAPLWRPDEHGWTKAGQLIELLEKGLAILVADPEKFKILNPSNGWGTYDGLVNFVREYLDACKEYPDADVHVSR